MSSAVAGAGAHVTSYTANNLNQYTARSNPGVAVARGVVHEAASLAVNGGEPTLLRSGERWVWERTVGNGGGPAWQAVNVTATREGVGPGGGDVTTARSGAVYVPPAAESPVHDADGNLTGDGRWMYSWDGENRLIAMETQPALVNAGAPRQRLEFGYDAQHRRVSKVVKQWDTATGAFIPQSRTTFVYDGWNLIAELSSSPALPISGSPRLVRSYEWGLDVSGTPTGAGGVGGLLIIRSYSASTAAQAPLLNAQPSLTATHAPCYDGNGNIAALVNLATGQTELVDLEGTMECTKRTKNRVYWKMLDLVIKPQNDRFDFAPLFSHREPLLPISQRGNTQISFALGDFVNLTGKLADMAGILGTFDIHFNGEISDRTTGSTICL